eukprot:15482524-Alexandrium_andersonii.AAC.1
MRKPESLKNLERLAKGSAPGPQRAELRRREKQERLRWDRARWRALQPPGRDGRDVLGRTIGRYLEDAAGHE